MAEKRRFGEITEEELFQKRTECIPKNTKKNNANAAEILREYLKFRNLPTDFENYAEEELAAVLCHFYINARTKQGDLYKAKSFENIRYSLNRYLKSPPVCKDFDVLTSKSFNVANECFKTAMVDIKKSGKGAVTHHKMILEKDLKKLYNSIFLTPETPSGLLNRVQMNIRLFFCRRANENMETMTKNTFILRHYEDGSRYVAKNQDEMTKNHRENSKELVSGHMPEDKNNPCICPVSTFLLYVSKLNPKCDRLWQYPKDSFIENEETWFQNRPIGRDTLSCFMKKLSERAGLSQMYTNHCIRVTGTSLLSSGNFSAAQIMSVTGHKSVSSLSVYQKVSDREKQAMGTAINNVTAPTPFALHAPFPAVPALPATTSFPPIEAVPMLPTLSVTRPDSAPLAKNTMPEHRNSMVTTSTSNVSAQLEGVNLEQLFSEFECESNSSNNVVGISLPSRNGPLFQGCSLSNFTLNINVFPK